MKSRTGARTVRFALSAAALAIVATGSVAFALPHALPQALPHALSSALSSTRPTSAPATSAFAAAPSASADLVYDHAQLAGIIPRQAVRSAFRSITAHGLEATRGTLAIADMSQPSTAKRLVLVDLESHELLLRTWVAHGAGSGGAIAHRFSNRNGSHATSLGLYRVGSQIVSPKHGAALLLDGLDKGLNDQARPPEVIIHGADYVSKRYIARTGRLGRSWGCPAVPRAEMKTVIRALEGDGLLYVYGA